MSVEKQTSLADAFREALSTKREQPQPLAWLVEQMNLATHEGDTEASLVLIRVGIALSQSLEIAVRLHPKIAEQAKHSLLFPVCLSAFEVEAQETIRFFREEVRLGNANGLRTSRQSGRKPFGAPDDGSCIARRLFLVMKEARASVDRDNRTLFSNVEKSKAKEVMQTYGTPEERLHLAVWALPELEGEKRIDGEVISAGNAVEWASVGARLMVDGCRFISGIPEIPAKWSESASKAKKGSPKGRLRDAVRKRLEKGFESIAPN
jgi:hypothetical protein